MISGVKGSTERARTEVRKRKRLGLHGPSGRYAGRPAQSRSNLGTWASPGESSSGRPSMGRAVGLGAALTRGAGGRASRLGGLPRFPARARAAGLVSRERTPEAERSGGSVEGRPSRSRASRWPADRWVARPSMAGLQPGLGPSRSTESGALDRLASWVLRACHARTLGHGGSSGSPMVRWSKGQRVEGVSVLGAYPPRPIRPRPTAPAYRPGWLGGRVRDVLGFGCGKWLKLGSIVVVSAT